MTRASPGSLPSFLGRLTASALGAHPGTLAAVESDGTIAWVNDAWWRFAADNGAADLAHRFPVGSSYFEGIHGPLRDFFRQRFDAALRTGTPFTLEYECSSASTYRVFRMRALPFDGAGLLVDHGPIVERPHERVAFAEDEVRYRSEAGLVTQCANCRRVRRTDGRSWDWVPTWVKDSPPKTSHGLCAPCATFYWRLRPSP
jgi:hypothetical protein